MRRRTRAVQEVSPSEITASNSSRWYLFSFPAAVLTSDTEDTWNSHHFAPATIILDLGNSRRVVQVHLLPDMKPATGLVRHSVRLLNSNRRINDSCVFYGYATDYTWITVNFHPVERSSRIEITTSLSPSWVAWRQIRVFEKFE